MSAAYLKKLNPEQRRAVQHGVRENDAVGHATPHHRVAGSGKTNTLARRVALSGRHGRWRRLDRPHGQ